MAKELEPEKVLVQMNEVDDLPTAQTQFPVRCMRLISDESNAFANPALYVKTESGQEIVFPLGGIGDVLGPGSSTDNAIPRYDGVTGKLIQNSGVLLDDTNNMTTPGNITMADGSIVQVSSDANQFSQFMRQALNIYANLGNNEFTTITPEQLTIHKAAGEIRVTATANGAQIFSDAINNANIDINNSGTAAPIISMSLGTALITLDTTGGLFISNGSSSSIIAAAGTSSIGDSLKIASLGGFGADANVVADNNGLLSIGPAVGAGDVMGPASSTDNAIARFDSVTGKIIQNSTVTLNDTGTFQNVQAVNLQPAGTVISSSFFLGQALNLGTDPAQFAADGFENDASAQNNPYGVVMQADGQVDVMSGSNKPLVLSSQSVSNLKVPYITINDQDASTPGMVFNQLAGGGVQNLVVDDDGIVGTGSSTPQDAKTGLLSLVTFPSPQGIATATTAKLTIFDTSVIADGVTVSVAASTVTIDVTGRYMFGVAFNLSTVTNNVVAQIYLFVNNVQQGSGFTELMANSGDPLTVDPTSPIDLVAGDVIDIRMSHDNAGTVTFDFNSASVYVTKLEEGGGGASGGSGLSNPFFETFSLGLSEGQFNTLQQWYSTLKTVPYDMTILELGVFTTFDGGGTNEACKIGVYDADGSNLLAEVEVFFGVGIGVEKQALVTPLAVTGGTLINLVVLMESNTGSTLLDYTGTTVGTNKSQFISSDNLPVDLSGGSNDSRVPWVGVFG
jgi:hypothetical protein